MLRFIGILLLALSIVASPEMGHAKDVSTPTCILELESPDRASAADAWSRSEALKDGAKVWSAACCKVCRKGKACGDSCISKSYTCRKGPGCACDG